MYLFDNNLRIEIIGLGAKMEKKSYINKIESSFGKEKIDALLAYSYFLRQSDPEESLQQAQKAREIAQEQGDRVAEIGALLYSGYALLYKGDFLGSKQTAGEMQEMSEAENEPNGVGSSLVLLGSIAAEEKELSKAVKYYLQAIDFFRETGNDLDLVSVYNNLGRIHLLQKHHKEAENYLTLALDSADKIESPARYPIRLNLANILYSQEKFEEALSIYLFTAGYFRENNLNAYEHSALSNAAMCYLHLGKPKEAMKLLLRLYESEKANTNSKMYCSLCGLLADACFDLEKPEGFLRYSGEAEQIALENGYDDALEEIYLKSAKFYKKSGDLKEENKYLYDLLDLKEKNRLRHREEKIEELETKYKTEIYKLRSRELDEKNKAMEKQIKSLNTSLDKQKTIYTKLQEEFQIAAAHINEQDDLISSQGRMALMGEMVSSIAHQWKQPLNVVWLLAQAIWDAWEFGEMDGNFLNKQVDLIGKQVTYMNETINDFRDFFKPSFEKEFKVSESVQEAVKLLNYILTKAGIEVEQNLNEDCTLCGNPNELSQVIINILNNAVDAIAEVEIKQGKVRIELECDREFVQIKLNNNGPRIPDDELEKVYEPYYTTKSSKGTGIGLHICRQIIEHKFKGIITSSNKADGVEFCIRIPLGK